MIHKSGAQGLRFLAARKTAVLLSACRFAVMNTNDAPLLLSF